MAEENNAYSKELLFLRCLSLIAYRPLVPLRWICSSTLPIAVSDCLPHHPMQAERTWLNYTDFWNYEHLLAFMVTLKIEIILASSIWLLGFHFMFVNADIMQNLMGCGEGTRLENKTKPTFSSINLSCLVVTIFFSFNWKWKKSVSARSGGLNHSLKTSFISLLPA